MRVILGTRALDVDPLRAHGLDPLLFEAARRLLERGPAMQQRGALVLLAMSCADLAPLIPRLADTVDYDAAHLGGVLAGVFTRLGADPNDALKAWAGAVLPPKQDAPPAPAAAPTAAPPVPAVPDGPRPPRDLYPGLLRNGEAWPAFVARGGPRTDEMKAWTQARVAQEQGRLEAWVATDGGALGFTWANATG